MMAVFSSAIYAQNDSAPWSITVGTNAVDLFETGSYIEEDLSLSPSLSRNTGLLLLPCGQYY